MRALSLKARKTNVVVRSASLAPPHYVVPDLRHSYEQGYQA